MKVTMKHLLVFSLISGFVLSQVSCKKQADAPSGKQKVQIFLTDGPVRYDAMYVDIQKVEVWTSPDSCAWKGDDDEHNGDHGDDKNEEYHSACGKWDTLDIRKGTYNLLSLSNGTDTLLASGLTFSGTIKKIRITLGSDNAVVIDSVRYPLSLHNNKNQILITAKEEDMDRITSSDLRFWMDFDAGRSIVKLSNNHFVLKPVIKLFASHRTASIEGHVLPNQANAVVSSIADGDTLIAFPGKDGYFKIRGIKSAAADIFINATNGGYKDTTIRSVPMQAGKETNIGTIRLHQ